jgi:hypothetical protein
MAPVGGAAEKSNPLAGHFVDDHEARVVPAAFASGNRSGGNAYCDGNHNAGEKSDEQGRGLRMETPSEGGPQQHSGH